ncbi:cell death-inducing p53-target protein 1 [Folsomia candida]|uniref:LITAF domain-containing protein n=1 Tax=Folsomia candida TaxID=158441 RepID=A0A226DMV5_FOLCA|nr:cell death-inducing p53-target protein 1 [Folsomia candida]OXA46872.1 hypothetical protein Fcan01_18196 [Folsomia candida]
MAEPKYPVLDIDDPPPPYLFPDGQQPMVHSSGGPGAAPPYELLAVNDKGIAGNVPLKKVEMITQTHANVSTGQGPSTRVIIISAISGHNPQRTICPHCRMEIVTVTRKETGSCQHCWALCICCFVGCPFCLIPYCCEHECGDTVHSCANCQMDVGTVHRM